MWITSQYETTMRTVRLREIVDNGDNSVDIWNFDYPSYYSGEEKKAFEQKFIDHYYDRQIGFETVGRFLHFFRSRIREIMPYYIKLYKLEEDFDKIEDKLESYNLKETYTSQNSGESSSQSSGTVQTNTEHITKEADTPQGSISNIEDHMSRATKDTANDKDTSSGQTSGQSSGTSTYTLERRGNIGVQPLGGEVRDIREAFINIDMMIIEDLGNLFLGIY